MWSCSQCGLETEDGIPPAVCRRCWALESYERLEQFTPPQLAIDIPDTTIPLIPTGEKAVDAMLWGGFPEGGRVIFWGKGGSGKSRLALRWFTQHVNCYYVSLDMAQPILLMSARSCGANLRRLYVTETHNFFQRGARSEDCSVVVIDAISDIDDRKEKWRLLYDLKRWVNGKSRIAVLICHQNKKGQHAGAAALQHWPDFEIQMKAVKSGSITATVLKSRTCPSGYCRTNLGHTYSDDNSENEDSPGVF